MSIYGPYTPLSVGSATTASKRKDESVTRPTDEAWRAGYAACQADVVAWLRHGFDTYPHGTFRRCSEMQSDWNCAADAIERGEHTKGEAQ